MTVIKALIIAMAITLAAIALIHAQEAVSPLPPVPAKTVDQLEGELNQLQLGQYSLQQTEAWLDKWRKDLIEQELKMKSQIDSTTAQLAEKQKPIPEPKVETKKK